MKMIKSRHSAAEQRLAGRQQNRNRKSLFSILPLILLFLLAVTSFARQPLSPSDILQLKMVTSAQISPDNRWIAYTVSVPRQASDKPGAAYSELYLVSVKSGEIRPFITGKVSVHQVRWRPDGQAITFLTKRGDRAKTQVWMIPLSGGEARPLTSSETGVLNYRWRPDGRQIAYSALTPATPREKALKKKGYNFVYFEENLKQRNLYSQAVTDGQAQGEPVQLTRDYAVWSFEFAPDGGTLAVAASKKNLIDSKYMFQKIYLFNPQTKQFTQLTHNEGKLGNFCFSPDGAYLAYAAASRRSDHAVSQAYVMPVTGGEAKNLTMPNFRGHINWVGWKDNRTVVYRAAEGVWNSLSLVNKDGGKRTVILHSRDNGIIFNPPSFTSGLKQAAFVGQTPGHPGEVFLWKKGKKMTRLTNVNPWLTERQLGEQTVVHYSARDGMPIEGILIYPVNYQKGQTYPLVVSVHGGPESHYSNGWMSYYFQPGQVLAGKGYAVFYPNYRASTGYGVEFAMKWHYGNPAGTEFDDVADGIDYLVGQGIADRQRVGLGGGSYGGFAAAWFGSYYTKYVRATCMFVGISDLISKRGTTDIPYEELYVHSGKKLEEAWDLSLKRSPIYWAHQSRTAVLILGGLSDTRVNPAQSLEMYRRLKMNNHPAVRLVQYPGEGHGNRRQPGRIDVLYRTLAWYDWYVKDLKPLDGPMPPLDISDSYGLDLPE